MRRKSKFLRALILPHSMDPFTVFNRQYGTTIREARYTENHTGSKIQENETEAQVMHFHFKYVVVGNAV